MNKFNSQNTINGADKTADSGAGSKTAPTADIKRTQDPRETAQEAVHQVTAKPGIKNPASGGPAKAAVDKPVLIAAKGDDELMSKPGKLS